ncbi:hypothetical protein FGIG_00710 [Fasciola gigantica]|uniref:Uncharacterized protein n=1 Tax=Fasciola gigantica TaxID=46835 RepID=A0A504Y6E7_FASGI|nr:hypothetical protein FGIG_00710 [Fasciola gigantica]
MPGKLLPGILCFLLCTISAIAIPVQTTLPVTEQKQLNIAKVNEPTPRSQKPINNRQVTDRISEEKKLHYRCPIEDQSIRCVLFRVQDRLNRMETIVYSIINITERVIAKLPDPECYAKGQKPHK